MSEEQRIENLVKQQTEKIQKRKPFLERVEVTYEKMRGGRFISKIKARTRKKTIVLEQENHCPDTSIKKLFNNLMRVLSKKRLHRRKRLTYNLNEAA